MRRFSLILSLMLATLSPTFAQKGIDFPQNLEPAPKPLPPPTPPPSDDVIPVLKPGFWWVVGSDRPLLIRSVSRDGGSVTIGTRKDKIVLPSDVVLGRTPDKDDPEFTTITAPYIYTFKAATQGSVGLEFVPSVNSLDKDGKQIPLTITDFVIKSLIVDLDKPVPPDPKPNPNPPDPKPNPNLGQIWGYVLIDESAEALATRGQWQIDVHTFCKANGLKWREADQNATNSKGEPPADIAKYMADAKTRGVARLYIVDINGKSFFEGQAGSSAEVIAQLKKFGGIK